MRGAVFLRRHSPRRALLHMRCTTACKISPYVIAPGNQADHQQDEKSHDPKAAAAEAAARLASPIFHIAAKATRSPTHKVLRV